MAKKFSYIISPFIDGVMVGPPVVEYSSLGPAAKWLAEHYSFDSRFTYVCHKYCHSSRICSYVGESECRSISSEK